MPNAKPLKANQTAWSLTGAVQDYQPQGCHDGPVIWQI